MANIKQQLRKIISRFVAIFPDRLWQFFLTLWLEKMVQREELTPQERDSLLLGFNLFLNKTLQEEPKAGLRSLLNIEDNLDNAINRLAIAYDNGVHVKHRLTKYHDFFTQRIHQGDRVLDIGCGNGSLAYDIAVKSGGIITGIDINSESIQFAKEHFTHPNLTFIEGDALVYKIEGIFDSIILSNILEHIEHRIEFLEGICNNFNPKKILIRVPAIDRHWLVPLRKELGLFYFSDITHYTEYTQQSFVEEINSAGLKIKHLQMNWGEIWAEVSANIQP